MTSARHIRLSVGVIVACMVTAGFGTEPNQLKLAPKFRISSPVRLSFEEPPSVTPTHVAQFQVEWGFAEPNDPNASDLLNTPAGKTFSGRQRDLLDTDRGFWMTHRIQTSTLVSASEIARHLSASPSDFGRYKWGRSDYCVRAVSEEDAKKMARALLEYMTGKGMDQARRNVERLKQIRPQIDESIAELKEKSVAKSSERPVTYQKYKDAIQNSPYSKYSIDQVPEEVRKTIFEMDKMLDVINIEIVGIQSKLSAINKHSQAKDVMQSQTLALTLREMAIRQEIELVGTESRRQATMSIKRREEALYSQYEAFRDIKGEIGALSSDIKRARNLRDRIAGKLRDLERGTLLFHVRSAVTVHRALIR